MHRLTLPPRTLADASAQTNGRSERRHDHSWTGYPIRN